MNLLRKNIAKNKLLENFFSRSKIFYKLDLQTGYFEFFQKNVLKMFLFLVNIKKKYSYWILVPQVCINYIHMYEKNFNID